MRGILQLQTRQCMLFCLSICAFLFSQLLYAQDFDVSTEKISDDVLEVRWYAPENNGKFKISIQTDGNAEVFAQVVSAQNVIEVPNLDLNADYRITVAQIDEKSHILAAGMEKFTGEISLKKISEKLVAKKNPKKITANLQVSMRSLNAQSFPFIYSTIDVSDGVAGIDNLTVSNFKAYEDGARQLDLFNVTPAGTGGGTRILDMIFLFDDSGSMRDEQQAVINNINNFVDQLVQRGIDFRLGLVRFGQSGGGLPILMNNGNLTDDVEYFKQMLGTFTANGGFEPGLQAVINAATGFSFRPSSQRHFLLITDEDSDGGSLPTAINYCSTNGIIVHSAVQCNRGTSQTDYCGPNSIRGATGGILKSVVGPYDEILDAILKDVASSYIVQYRTTNNVTGGGQREVRVNVAALGQNKNVYGYYGFGWPIITRTTATKNLSATAQVQFSPITIRVKVTDAEQPFVQSVTCYYRKTGTSNYSSLNMVNIGNNIFEAVIPGSSVLDPGIDYYVRASDGQTTSTCPEQDPSLYPFQIAVLPNQAPVISHTPVLNGTVGSSVTISATITDYTNYVSQVQLFSRKYGTLIYTTRTMNLSNGKYKATIPGSEVTSNGVEYYIRAIDNLGVGSIHGVHLLQTGSGGGGGNCPPDVADNFEDGNANGWLPMNANRWEIVQDGAYYYYGINTTAFGPVGSEALGELSIYNSQNYDDFKLSVYAKTAENLSSNGFAEFAAVFGYVDAQNYFYVMINSDKAWSQVFKVTNNVRSTLFNVDARIADNDFHLLHLEKQGTTLKVFYDGLLVGSKSGISIPPGKMGIGAYNDQAYFDDFQIMTSCSSPQNIPPVIIHTPITSAAPASTINIAATVTDHTDYVDYVRLYYRRKGDPQYTLVNMPLSGSKYVATIPPAAVTPVGVEYFLAARDNLGDLAQTQVYTIFVVTVNNCPPSFTDNFEDGNSNEWTLYHPSRWSFANENGNTKFFINTTQYLSPGGERLGEYALVKGKYYDDFNFKCLAKTETAGAANYYADLVLVFGYQNDANYYYAMYNSKEEYTGLYLIKDGMRTELAKYDPATMGDGAYHEIQVSRSAGNIYVYYDNQIIMSKSDQTFGTGQVGIGSYNDQAWFDDIRIESCSTPGQPPDIEHTPITMAPAGSAVPISATITDASDYVASANLYYRIQGAASFSLVNMSASGSLYSATIPAVSMSSAGVEYYIKAWDNLNFTSETPRYLIREQLPPCSGDFSDDFEDGNADGWQALTPAHWEVLNADGSKVYNLHSASSGDEWTLLATKKWGDFAIEFDARSTAGIYKNYTLLFGLPNLTDGIDNGFYLKFGVGTVELYKQVNGAGTLLKSVNQDYVDDNYYHHIRVEHDGALIKVWADGNFVMQQSDNSWQSGYVGFNVFKSTSRFDNVCISALQPEATIQTPSSIDAAPGRNVIIPVNLSTVQNISLMQLTFEFDRNLIDFVDAQIGAGTQGFTLGQINRNPVFPPQTPGTNKNVIVQLSGGGINSVSGNNIHILNLVFKAVGSINTFSPLELDKECTHSFLTTSDPFDMCGPTLHTNRCNVVISQSSGLTGQVSYFDGGNPVAGATVEISENGQFVKSATTDSSGQYQLTNLGATAYSISASKAGKVSSAISGSDALLAMRAIAFIVNLTPDQTIAADVDRSGGVTGSDVVAILRQLAFVQSGLAGCGEWRITPENAQVNPANSSSFDFIAHILGDVNGSWAGNGATKIAAPAELQWHIRSEGKNVQILELFNGKSSSIVNSGQITVEWNFEPQSNPVFNPLKKTTSVTSPVQSGKTHVAFVTIEGFQPGEKIGEFRLQGSETDFTQPNISRNATAIINDTPAIIANVQSDVFETAVPTEITLYSNYPNPFNIETRIAFAIPDQFDGQHAKLQIFTITGVKIRNLLNAKVEKGVHELIWDGRDDQQNVVSSGVYLFRLQVGMTVRTRKLMLLK